MRRLDPRYFRVFPVSSVEMFWFDLFFVYWFIFPIFYEIIWRTVDRTLDASVGAVMNATRDVLVVELNRGPWISKRNTLLAATSVDAVFFSPLFPYCHHQIIINILYMHEEDNDRADNSAESVFGLKITSVYLWFNAS